MPGEFVILGPGSGINVKLIEFKQLFPVLPAVKSWKDIGAGDHYKFASGIFFLQISKCMDGVGGTGKIKFNIGGFKTIIIGNSFVYHAQPLVFGQQAAALLQGILGRYHKPYFIQVAEFQHIAGNDQVPGMNRVK